MNDSTIKPIGVFDSGVGGLTVVKEIQRSLPIEALLYLGDTARVPYGTKSAKTVVRYALQAGVWLEDQGVKALVIACNSASAVALPALRERLSIPVFGVIEPGAEAAVSQSSTRKIGVLATRGTVRSRAYSEAILNLDPACEVFESPAPLLVPLAEEGWQDHAVAEQIAEIYCRPLLEAQVDTIVLGCTHYPLLKSTLKRVVGADVALVDSAAATAIHLKERLHEQNLLNSNAESVRIPDRWCVTDGPEVFEQVASRFLGQSHPLECISIEIEEEEQLL